MQTTNNRMGYWKLKRVAYYCALIAVFSPFAMYFLPNLLNFGQWTSLTPADLVPQVQQQFVPIIRAIKEYRRDFGFSPTGYDQLTPRYLTIKDRWRWWPLGSDESVVFPFPRDMIFGVVYRSNPPSEEGWYVESKIIHGRIPLPPVTIAPSTISATTMP